MKSNKARFLSHTIEPAFERTPFTSLTLCEVNPDHATDVAGQFTRLVSLLRDAV